MVGHIARMEDSRILIEKPIGKRLLGRSRCTWEGNIRIDLGD